MLWCRRGVFSWWHRLLSWHFRPSCLLLEWCIWGWKGTRLVTLEGTWSLQFLSEWKLQQHISHEGHVSHVDLQCNQQHTPTLGIIEILQFWKLLSAQKWNWKLCSDSIGFTTKNQVPTKRGHSISTIYALLCLGNRVSISIGFKGNKYMSTHNAIQHLVR